MIARQCIGQWSIDVSGRLLAYFDRLMGLDIDPSDRVDLVRARLLMFCPTIFGIFGGSLCYLYAQTPDSNFLMVAVAGIVSVILCAVPLILYATKSIKLAGWLTLCCGALAVVPEPIFDMGFREPEVIIMVIQPLLAGLLISRQGATLTYGAVVIALSAVLIRMLHWPPETLVSVTSDEHYRFFLYALTACTSAYILTLCFISLFQASIRDVELAVAEAEAASEAKSAFLANVSHELRTPINGILGFSKLALNGNLGADERSWVSTIETSGESLLNIVNDVLDMSKLEAGALDIEDIEFDLHEVLDQALAISSQAAGEKVLHLGAVADSEMPQYVRGDPGRLRQVLTNLITNAVKFTDTGGVVVNISSTPMQDGRHKLTFEVVDTGIGIPEDKIPALFDRFTQVDTSRARKFNGAGLGLAICKDLIELMGGTLGVRSVEGRGSVFWFTIFCPTGTRNNTDESTTLSALDIKHVLVAGDASLHRSIIERQLQQHGVSYRYCDFGPDFQQRLQDQNLAVIITLDPPRDIVDLLEREDTKPKQIRISSNPNSRQLTDGTGNADLALTAPIGHTLVFDALRRVLATSPAVPDTSPSLDHVSESGGRILLAEDNLGNQLLFQTLLKNAGYAVDTVANGQEAVEAVRKKSYDLVLMDGQMPEMDGVEATKEIRKENGPKADVPIIAITANTMSGDREQYLDAGMNDYLPKPIDFDEFYAKVSRWVDQNPAKTDSEQSA